MSDNTLSNASDNDAVAGDLPAVPRSPVASGETQTVSLTIPCLPDYVGTARLAILGVASHMGFSYDQVEDIRLAVGEACANAIERSSQRSAGGDATITIRSIVESARLVIEVEDHAGGSPIALDETATGSEVEDFDGQELGALLMEILVDEMTVETLPGGGALVRLVKYSGEA